jgi:small subunit ribosomal protein S6
MRAYELMVIFDADTADADVQGHLKTMISEIVEADGGSVAKVDNWGRRRFAYRIRHKGVYALEGNYVVLEILLPERKDLSVTSRALRLADDVVRHKVIRLPESEATKRGLFGAVETSA